MKDRQFWAIVIILILQSAFIIYKFDKVEENQEHIQSTAVFNWRDTQQILKNLAELDSKRY